MKLTQRHRAELRGALDYDNTLEEGERYGLHHALESVLNGTELPEDHTDFSERQTTDLERVAVALDYYGLWR